MIELIHCHIIKTGGVSFLQVIEEVYGRDKIAFPWTWLNMAPEEGRGFELLHHDFAGLMREWDKIPGKAKGKDLKVLQGHFPVLLFHGMFPEAKRICFVRNPVERVVSQYYHDMNKGHQPKMSIEKYIHQRHNQNQMWFYMNGDIDKFDFVGTLETMQDDLFSLASLLGWNHVPELPRKNVGIYPRKISWQIEKIIRDSNMKDLQIYNEVLERRP